MQYISEQGFTLVELMIALILGLLISAAALQILYTNQVSANIQKAGAKVIETNTFGQDFFTKQLRRANQGSTSFKLNHTTAQGGVVLTAPDDLKKFGNTVKIKDKNGKYIKDKDGNDIKVTVASNLRGLSKSGQQIPLDLLTVAQSSKSKSNTTVANSDQLTIQYQMPFDGYRDCQGRNVRKGDYVIERYFVREDDNKQLGLACASAIYTYDETKAKKDATNQNAIDIDKYTKPDETGGTSDLAGNGEIIIPNVDYFRVLLGVSDRDDFATKPQNYKLKYMPIPAHGDLATALDNKRIVNLQASILVRSSDSVTAAQDPEFQILDKTVKLKEPYSKDGKMRRVLTSTVLFRNARGTVDAS